MGSLPPHKQRAGGHAAGADDPPSQAGTPDIYHLAGPAPADMYAEPADPEPLADRHPAANTVGVSASAPAQQQQQQQRRVGVHSSFDVGGPFNRSRQQPSPRITQPSTPVLGAQQQHPQNRGGGQHQGFEAARNGAPILSVSQRGGTSTAVVQQGMAYAGMPPRSSLKRGRSEDDVGGAPSASASASRFHGVTSDGIKTDQFDDDAPGLRGIQGEKTSILRDRQIDAFAEDQGGLPAEKGFPIQIGSELFRLSGASIMSDGERCGLGFRRI